MDILNKRRRREGRISRKTGRYFFLPSPFPQTHTHVFFKESRAESWPDSRAGFHVTETAANSSESTKELFAAQLFIFTDYRWWKTTACQSVAAPSGGIFFGPDRIPLVGPEYLRAVLRFWPGQTENGAGPECNLHSTRCWIVNSLFSFAQGAAPLTEWGEKAVH